MSSCLVRRNVFTLQYRALFLAFGRGGSLSNLGVFYILFSSIYYHASWLEQIWSIILSLELTRKRCPCRPGLCCTLTPGSQHAGPQPSLFPPPRFPRTARWAMPDQLAEWRTDQLAERGEGACPRPRRRVRCALPLLVRGPRSPSGEASAVHSEAEPCCLAGAAPSLALRLKAVRSWAVSTKPFASYHVVGFFFLFPFLKNKFGFWFTNHEFIPHRTHQRPVKLIAFPSVYKAILYYKELIFLSHAWLFLF